MLSKKTKYAINALVYLVKHNKKRVVPISQIAKSENISRKFLEAILLDLKNARILNSKQGKYGGYYLNKMPEEINIAEIMRLFDGQLALIPCVSENFYEPCEECKDESTCGIRDIFAEVRHEMVQRLQNTTLATIIEREERLAYEKRYGIPSN